MLPSNPHKYAHIERERRWLLDALPPDLSPDSEFNRIFDLYITDTNLRLRRMEGPDGQRLAYKFGKKESVADQPTHTIITNLYLSTAEYAALSTLPGTMLVKRRYRYADMGRWFSLDVFEGNLEGLMLAEIEADSDEDLAAIPLPSFARKEVTDDRAFTGGVLVTLSAEAFQRWRATW